MSQAQIAFVEQIKRDRAGNEYFLAKIADGEHLYSEDGTDITAERKTDAERRLADCNAILAEIPNS